MVFPFILLLATAFLILSICLYVHYRRRVKNYEGAEGEKYRMFDLLDRRGFWGGWIIATPIITVVVFLVGSLCVSGNSSYDSNLSYAENIREAGVDRFIPLGGDTPKHMFILDNGETVIVAERNLDILESSGGPGKVRYGHAYESWGHWLPFNDWLTDDYQVEYTPGK